MKKILSLVLATIVLAGTGCLKDKGFEANKYGINDPDNSAKGVGFPLGANASNSRAVEISTTEQTFDVTINLESGVAADQDVHVQVVSNPGVISTFNASTVPAGTIVAVPASLFNFSAAVTISKGSRFATFKVKVPNTTTLNPNITYGIGLSLASVDGGYLLAQNLKNVLFVISVKNKYDGKYSEKGYFNHPSYANPFTLSVQLWTTGPNSVVLYYPPFDEFDRPFNVGGGSINRFADIAPVFTIDPTTNKVTVVNYFSTGSALTLDPAYNSRYDPATKTIYAKYGYNAARTRDWTDTLTFTGPR